MKDGWMERSDYDRLLFGDIFMAVRRYLWML
jgi:hypothetical protein